MNDNRADTFKTDEGTYQHVPRGQHLLGLFVKFYGVRMECRDVWHMVVPLLAHLLHLQRNAFHLAAFQPLHQVSDIAAQKR